MPRSDRQTAQDTAREWPRPASSCRVSPTATASNGSSSTILPQVRVSCGGSDVDRNADYKATLSERSQVMLEGDYDKARQKNKIVLFVRDEATQRMVSFLLDYK